MTLVQFVTQFFSTLNILSHIAIAVFLVLLFLKKGKNIISFLAKNAMLLSFIVTLFATSGSLYYSEIAGYQPCGLCWFQRIFMYPLTIIFLVALIKKEKRAIDSAIVLSVVGAAIALYHYVGQLGFAGNLPCPVVGYSVSCSKIFFMEFGYITFPLMSLTAFVLITILQLLNKKTS